MNNNRNFFTVSTQLPNKVLACLLILCLLRHLSFWHLNQRILATGPDFTRLYSACQSM